MGNNVQCYVKLCSNSNAKRILELENAVSRHLEIMDFLRGVMECKIRYVLHTVYAP
jgi:hypothetical protein